MAARERWLRGVGAELGLRGGAFLGGGLSGVPALKRPDPEPEPELEPEKEDDSAPNIAVVITVQLGFTSRRRRADSVQLKSTLERITLSSPHPTLHTP
jgi:hypothetical protein